MLCPNGEAVVPEWMNKKVRNKVPAKEKREEVQLAISELQWILSNSNWKNHSVTIRALFGHYSGTIRVLFGHYSGTIRALFGHYLGHLIDISFFSWGAWAARLDRPWPANGISQAADSLRSWCAFACVPVCDNVCLWIPLWLDSFFWGAAWAPQTSFNSKRPWSVQSCLSTRYTYMCSTRMDLQSTELWYFE